MTAQDTLSKSIKKKKHSKKQSIPKQKAHYLLLMGSPVEDDHNHKGLGMILSSKLREEPDKLKDGSSKGTDHHHHHHNKADSDLAATLQTSSKGYPSDRGYSYTEALFTGAPLLNGRPFMASDRNQGHEDGHSIGPTVNGHAKAADGYKGARFAELQVDKSNEHNKEEGSVQIQKEVHTEEGVSGIAIVKKPKESQHFEKRPSSEAGKEDYDSHQYLIPRPSLNASPFKSKSEMAGNTKYTQIHETAGSSSQMENHKEAPLSDNNVSSYAMRNNHYQHEDKSTENDRPAEQVHQILETGKTEENFPSNAYGSGPSVEEPKVNNKFPDKTNIKSYDEESNLLGSSVYSHGPLVDNQGDRVVDHKHHQFSPNLKSGHIDYGQTHNLVTEESLNKPGMDTPPSRVESSEKETSAVPEEGLGNALSNGFKTNEDISKVGDQNIQLQSEVISTPTGIESAANIETEAPYEQRGHQALYQSQVQHLESNVKDANEPMNANNLIASGEQNSRATDEARKIPIENSNDSLPLEGATSDKGAFGADQLRPHKIIESSFDEELTHRIVTGPSSQQGNHAVPIEQTTEKETEDASHTGSDKTEESSKMSPGPSLPFREGSNPSESSHRNMELAKSQTEQSVDASTPSSIKTASGGSENEEITQQDTSHQRFSASTVDARAEHEDTFTNDASSHKGQGNMEVSQGSTENASDTNDGSSARLINSQGQHEANIEIPSSLSYREGSSSTTFSHQNEELSKDQGEQSSTSEETEAIRQKETSHKLFSESRVDSTFDHENTFANGADSHQGQVNVETLQSNVALQPNTNDASSDNSHGHMSNQREEQSVETSAPSTEAARVLPFGSQTEATKQQDTSNEISSGGPVNEANSNQEQQRVESLQSSMEHETEANSGSSENLYTSPGHASNQQEAGRDTSHSSSYREGSNPKTFSHQNEELTNAHRGKSVAALSPSSESARVGSLSSSNIEVATQNETSQQMVSASAVDTRPDREDTFFHGTSSHQGEEHVETSQSNGEHGPERNYGPSDSSINSPGPKLSSYKHREFKVGTPEVSNEMPVSDQSKAASEEQQPLHGTETKSERISEGSRNNQQKENDHDNKKPENVVYFLKMAKGFPLLNSRKTSHYSEGKATGNRGAGEHSTNTVKEGQQINSIAETGPEVNGRRRYPWKWQRKPSRLSPRPSPSYRPSPQPSPYPSPSPSPSSGGGGGALGGSSASSNEPQGKHFQIASCF